MPVVVGIRFKDSGKTYFFDPNGVDPLASGDHVIVETVRGLELAKVAHTPREVPDSEVVGELKPVVRRAEAADFERMRLLSARHDEVLDRCAEKINEHALPMRLVKAEYSFDGSRLTFYFTAEKRVDFRMLVRDLARTFKTRIELRQIGPRDEAKLLGGIGPCGRLLCCATFLPDYARVSIKMAKDQDLPLNPTKISGVCGRLLCCLSYEHDQYVQIKAAMPKKGAWVQTPDGPGEVISVNVVRETVMVELHGSGLHEEFTPTQLGEATQRVGEVARSRVQQGVAPFAGDAPPPPNGLRRERPAPPPRREPKHTGERRLLRDEVIDPDVLDALALLEEGLEERPAAPDRPAAGERRPSEPPADRSASEPRRAQSGPPRRPPQAQAPQLFPPTLPPRPRDPEEGSSAADSPAEPPPRQELRHGQPQADQSRAQRPPRRKRRGGRGER
jgi:cell fate regulator YaaT (PSP1 superfamily)